MRHPARGCGNCGVGQSFTSLPVHAMARARLLAVNPPVGESQCLPPRPAMAETTPDAVTGNLFSAARKGKCRLKAGSRKAKRVQVPSARLLRIGGKRRIRPRSATVARSGSVASPI